MKAYIIILLSALCCLSFKLADAPNAFADSGESLRTMPIVAFKGGEVLKYKLHYGFVNAGVAELQVMPNPVMVKGQRSLHVVATGKSISAFEWFYRVRDRYETYIDEQALVPHLFIRDCDEGGFIIKQRVSFDQVKKKAISNDKEFLVPANIQDILSAFYYARNLNVSNMKVGESFVLPIFLDDEVFEMNMRFDGREVIKTDLGKFRVMKFTPTIQEGRVFKDDEGLSIYVTDDANKIPVSVKAEVLIGSIKMSITGFEGLKHPLTSKIK